MEKGQGKGTDTLAMDNDFVRRGDVKRLLENTVCLHEELPAQIDIIHAADVVPVVRCGECVDGEGEGLYRWCKRWGHYYTEDWFCSDGARMDGGEE